jgi:hypothetical protein
MMRTMLAKPSAQRAIFIAGMLFSLMMVIIFPELYHHWDVRAFWRWSQFWDKSWRDIYVNCDTCNYPILGMLSSAGLLSLLGDNDQKAVLAYRIILGIVDGLNILLIFGLLKRFAIRNAAFWAGITGLLLSSWAGGALWGQIDGVSQFFLLAALFWIVGSNLAHRSQKHFTLYLSVSSFLLSCALLTKQLAVFSLFSLGLLLATSVLFFERRWQRVVRDLLLVVICCLACILAGDLFLNLKPPYFSHLYYIFKTGSDQANEIARNGFNMWIFLGRPMRSSSHISLIADTASPLASILTPYTVGIFLFVTYNVILALSLLRLLLPRFRNGERTLTNEVLLNFVMHLALVNLACNVFLTGTHERYLYHFYPYVILACLGLRKYSPHFSNEVLGIIVFGAILYGVLSGYVTLQKTTMTWIVGLFHAGLLGYLSLNVLKYQRFFHFTRTQK